MTRHYFWRTLVNCVLPTTFLCLAAVSAWFGPENNLSNTIFGLPAVYIGLALICVALTSIFRAHFNDSVADSLVWAGIFVSGLALISFFAFLHGSQGILCTAPICPDTFTASVSDPRFATPIGASHAAGWIAPDTTEPTVQVDMGVASAVYYSTVTFTTLGYGDFQPVPRMRTLAGIEASIGYGYLGMVIGLLINWGDRR